VVCDSHTGLSTVGAAQYIAKSPGYSSGVVPMGVLDGAWDEIVEDVNATIRFVHIPGAVNICTLFVRGRDNAPAQNWGAWYFRTFTVINGDIRVVGIEESRPAIPIFYSLSSPMPNPTKGTVRINYAVPKTARVNLKIYNCLGQVVRILVDREQKPGFYTINWDGKDDTGRKLPAGIYFYQMISEDFIDTKKAVLLK
jgi:hypothetical protein